MRQLQASVDSAAVEGAPHLKHEELREMILATLRSMLVPGGRWLDVGAGHGTFVAVPLFGGMSAVATEMSATAAAQLAERFPGERLEVREATDEDPGLRDGDVFDVVSMISVLHHIPDYTGFVQGIVDRHVRTGGTFVCYQDPLFYPRLRMIHRALNWALYYSWRITRGGLRQGIGTAWRRLRGRYDETAAADMVEYHVVRLGVDEEALRSLLAARFEVVRVVAYWSAHGRWQQRLGRWLRLANTFGIEATGRRATESVACGSPRPCGPE